MSPIHYRDYPKDWPTIRARILHRAEYACEGSPAFPGCRALYGQPHPVTGSKVVLTIAHLDHDTAHNDDTNLKAWCQRCHLNYDAHHHRRSRCAEKELEYPYEWRVRARLPEYFGYPCAVTARGAMNSARVVFPDGHVVITSRNYLRRRKFTTMLISGRSEA